jgi:hypothetical protein
MSHSGHRVVSPPSGIVGSQVSARGALGFSRPAPGAPGGLGAVGQSEDMDMAGEQGISPIR